MYVSVYVWLYICMSVCARTQPLLQSPLAARMGLRLSLQERIVGTDLYSRRVTVGGKHGRCCVMIHKPVFNGKPHPIPFVRFRSLPHHCAFVVAVLFVTLLGYFVL